jgi:cytochrome P450
MTIPHGLPTARGRHPFDPPEELATLPSIGRMTFPDGHAGWLVTGYATARAILSDRRFSSRNELRRAPVRTATAQESPEPAPPGILTRSDPPDHTRYRRLLTGQFTVRRMKMLEPGIERIVEEHLDAMADAGPGADLVRAFALPIPSLVICELLGVPYADRELFQRDTATMFDFTTPTDQLMAAMASITGYLDELVRRKRAEPADDLLSGLTHSDELTDEELRNIGLTLLVAGHETTANMLALGTFALLCNPEQLAALRADPVLVANTVEELMRYLSVAHVGPTRGALEDVEIDGQLIRAGEVVTISLSAANRDPARFDRPDELDITRSATGHLAFGHGIHQCLGQQLARVEMRIAFPALFRRFPALRLAVPAEEVPLREATLVYGVHELPVTW